MPDFIISIVPADQVEKDKRLVLELSPSKPRNEISMGAQVDDKACPLCAQEEPVPVGTKVAGCVLCEQGKPHIHNFF